MDINPFSCTSKIESLNSELLVLLDELQSITKEDIPPQIDIMKNKFPSITDDKCKEIIIGLYQFIKDDIIDDNFVYDNITDTTFNGILVECDRIIKLVRGED